MLKKVLIANRGEIACRIIRTCKEMGIETVAIYTECDSKSLHVALADESFKIGPNEAEKSYLNMDSILTVAMATQCDAIHPGYGFLAENAEFCRRCKNAGIIFIGPTDDVMELLGEKKNAKEFVQTLHIPTIPGFYLTASLDQAELKALAEKIGYPLLVKATAGGGGKGIKVCYAFEELLMNLKLAKEEAKQFSVKPDLFVEKYIQKFRHIEVQLLADQFNNQVHIGSRDCTIQQNMQKVIEEAPSTNSRINEIIDAARLIIAESHYTSLGTVEFIFDLDTNKYYFLEVNPRVQVEHPVSEMITGLDLISEQLKVAAGLELTITQKEIIFSNYCIESRINAQNIFQNFMLSCGTVKNSHFPMGQHVRVESHIMQGSQITPYYDAMIAKVIVKGRNRQEAIRRMQVALSEVYIDGVDTNLPFLQALFTDENFLHDRINNQLFDNVSAKITDRQ